MLTPEEWLEYPIPSPMAFPDGYKLPDAICAGGGWWSEWDGENKQFGVMVQLLSPRAFHMFPQAPKDGPQRGMVWFTREQLSGLLALEELHGMEFAGLSSVVA